MENNFAPAVIKNIRIKEHKIEFSENSRGLPVARHFRMMSSGKNKGLYKYVEGIYFQNEEKRAAWVAKKVDNIKGWIKIEEDQKAAKKAARADMKHDFEVGQVYYDSWGYDQTNIDFYKIVEVKEKSVVIQEIAGEYVEGTAGHDSMNVKPSTKGDGSGKKEVKIIQCGISSNGKPFYYIKSRHGWISKYDAGEKGVYSSWGH